MNGCTSWTKEKREKFLDVIRETGNISAAARMVGTSRSDVYYNREHDPEFAKAWDHAYQSFLDDLEAALAARGKEGVLDPVFYQGEVCGQVRKFSDVAACAILNGRRSEVFRNRMEHSGVVEQRVRLTFGKKAEGK